MTYYEFMGLLIDDIGMLAFSIPIIFGFLFTILYVPYKNWRDSYPTETRK